MQLEALLVITGYLELIEHEKEQPITNEELSFFINYHVNFLMKDATMITKHEGIVIEAENEKQVQDLVHSLSYFKN